MALSTEGNAPAIFSKTHNGVPIYAMIPSFLFGAVFVVIFELGPTAAILFDWLLNITGLTIITSWTMICAVHLRYIETYR